VNHVGVIGGGVVGLASGLALVRRGIDVTLIDDDAEGLAASWGNAGHIAIEQVEPLASLAMLGSLPGRLFCRGGAASFPVAALPHWLPFGLRLVYAAGPSGFRRGRDALRGLLAQAMPSWERLVSDIDAPDLLRAHGHLVIWHDRKAAKAGRAAWQTADKGTARVVDACAADLARITAIGAAAPVAGLRFQGTGQITDLGRLRTILRHAFKARGGTIHQGTATLLRDGGRVALEGLEVDLVLVSAGARSAKVLASAGHRVPLIAERGYHLRCDPAGWPADLPPIVFEDRGMIASRFESALQIASFVEFSHIAAPPDPRKWERLERSAAELGLPRRGPWRRWMGSRPTLPDYLPAIGRSRLADNLFYAFGHQHLGLTLAPLTSEIVADMIVGEQPCVPMAAFDLARFG
jgi:D-amino-acid dehydrogenase